MSGGRLKKRIVFEILEGAVRRGWGGSRKSGPIELTERHPGVWHSGGLESDGVRG